MSTVAVRRVSVSRKDVHAYSRAAGDEAIHAIRQQAEPFVGARVLHLSSTERGGGVAEHLWTHLPLLRDLGLEAEWHVIDAPDEFWRVTKTIHNSLQGMEVPWTERMEAMYLATLEELAPELEGSWDFIVVHDPQPAGILTHLAGTGRFREARWAWRCHIDLSTVNPTVWDFLRPHVERYDATIWTMDEFVPSSLTQSNVAVFPPGIDPLALKNVDLDSGFAEGLCTVYGVDPTAPMVCQVSRFDPWKDPIGVIAGFELVHEHIPETQLVLIGSMADDDPEGARYWELTEEARVGRDHIHLLRDVDDVVVNSFQRLARVVVQKSLREGFGLTVSEALWKGRPVVAGRAGGIQLQVRDGVDGYLVDTPEQLAARTLELLQHPALADDMGAAGREQVRTRFLLTRELEDYLRLLSSLGSARPGRGTSSFGDVPHDPQPVHRTVP